MYGIKIKGKNKNRDVYYFFPQFLRLFLIITQGLLTIDNNDIIIDNTIPCALKK